MPRTPLKWLKRIIAFVVIPFMLLFMALEVYSTHASRVAHEMAGEYATKTQPQIATDPRFKNVSVYRYSGFGCARIAGWVSTPSELEALHAFIATTSPPTNIQIMWSVKVNPNPDPRELDEIRSYVTPPAR